MRQYLTLPTINNEQLLLLACLLSIVASVLTAIQVHAAPVNWGECSVVSDGLPDAGQQCATLEVPRDYKNPNGTKISIAISRVLAADPEKRRGTLFLNPGGPGRPGLDLPRAFAAVLPQAVLDQYDLIGFDPRFVGQSSPITCNLEPTEAIRAFPPIELADDFDRTTANVQQVAARCGQAFGHMLPYATTENTARDIDSIRRALGEAKISYLGYSYGTYLGAVYATLFPQNADRMVLDSSVDPHKIWRQQFRMWGLGGEVRFPDFAKFAAANDDTYHLGATPKAVRQNFFKFVDKLNANPFNLEGLTIDGSLFRVIAFSNLYNDAYFTDLAATWQFLEAATAGAKPPTPVAKLLNAAPLSVDTPSDNEAAAGLAIICGDVAWSRNVERYKWERQIDSALFPLFGRHGSTIWPCAFWSHTPTTAPVSVNAGGQTRLLIVQNLRDPATPYVGAIGMRAALGGQSRLVSVDQGGHAAYAVKNNSCANNTTSSFLTTGLLPVNDTFCPATNTSEQRSQSSAAIDYLTRLIR